MLIKLHLLFAAFLSALTQGDEIIQWERIRLNYSQINHPSATPNLKDYYELASQFFSTLLLIQKDSNFSIDLNSTVIFSMLHYNLQINLVESLKTNFNLNNQSDWKIQSDHLVLVNISEASNDFIGEEYAIGQPITVDPNKLRPIVSLIRLNNFYYGVKAQSPFEFDKKLRALISATLIGLGIYEPMMYDYQDSGTGKPYRTAHFPSLDWADIENDSQSNNRILTFPRTSTYLKSNFRLSNNGTSRSGLIVEKQKPDRFTLFAEKSVFRNEILAGFDQDSDMLITELTAWFLQDTGFYRVMRNEFDWLFWLESYTSLEVAEKMIKQKADKTGNQCSLSNQAIFNKSNVINCLDASNQKIDEDYFQNFGPQSMCFEGAFTKYSQDLTLIWQPQSCYNYECNYTTMTMTIKIGEHSFSCTQKENPEPEFTGNSSLYFRKPQCPSNITAACLNKNKRCPYQCNSKGICLAGKVDADLSQCICLSGYSGEGCESPLTKWSGYVYLGEVVEKCPPDLFPLEDLSICVGCPMKCAECDLYNHCTKCLSGYFLRGGFCDNYEFESSATKLILFIFLILVLN